MKQKAKKVCAGDCKRELPVDEFHKAATGKYGVRATCKRCRNKKNRSKKHPRSAEGKKFCIMCGKKKTVDKFYSCKLHKDGLFTYCKDCSSKEKRLKKYKRQTDGEKHCKRCNETKHVSCFYKNKTSKDGLTTCCKECESKKVAESLNRTGRSKKRIKKDRVRAKTRHLANTGRILRLQCKRCDSPDVHAHHAEYDSPDAHLNVTWLCEPCHRYVHDLLRKLEYAMLERRENQG